MSQLPDSSRGHLQLLRTLPLWILWLQKALQPLG